MVSDSFLLTSCFFQGFAIAACAAIVPGPDFLLVTRSSLSGGRRAGLLCTAGIGLGLSIYAVITFLASTALASAPPSWFTTVRVIGAGYLSWIGLGMIRSAGASMPSDQADEPTLRAAGPSYLAVGAATALTNPKLMLFLLAIVGQVVAARDRLDCRAAIMVGVVIGPLCCFSALSVAGGLLHRHITTSHVRIIDRISGGILIGFATLGLISTL